MNMDFSNYSKFFKNKKILITGNTGFVGSYLSLTLNLMNAKVLGYSLKKKILITSQIQKIIKKKSKLFMMI